MEPEEEGSGTGKWEAGKKKSRKRKNGKLKEMKWGRDNGKGREIQNSTRF